MSKNRTSCIVSGGKIIVNGREITGMDLSGKRVDVTANGVFINGDKITSDSDFEEKNIAIEIHGDVRDVESSNSLIVNGSISGKVEVDNSLTCSGDIIGNVSAGGSLTCGNVSGDVKAGGSVRCGSIRGNVKAGGSVHRG